MTKFEIFKLRGKKQQLKLIGTWLVFVQCHYTIMFFLSTYFFFLNLNLQFGYNLERIWHMCSNGDSDTIRKVMSQVDQNEVNIPLSILNVVS